MSEYLKKEHESITGYSIRLYRNRQAYGLSFKDCGKLMNEVSGQDYSEAKYRREIESYIKIDNYLQQENPTRLSEDERNEIEEEKQELQKMKWRMADQKRLMNAELRKMSRLEHLAEYLEEVVEEVEPVKFNKTDLKDKEDKEVMVVISDEHIGAKIDSRFNVYNIEVAKQRFQKLQDETMKRVKRENANKLYIAHLGDGVNGLINVTGRITEEESTIQQLITLSNILEGFIETFLQEGIEVVFASVAGNHSRLLPNKKESLGTAENFERLLTVFLGKAFKQFDNYTQIDDEEGIIILDINGKTVVLVHGDLDKGAGITTKLNDLLGISIDYIFTGHFHNFFIKEHGNAIQYGVGSMAGLDQYAISGRFSGKPSQLITTFDDSGIDDIKVVYF